jgi:Nucleotidyl transferase AbiEii toxin, Type IV TA system
MRRRTATRAGCSIVPDWPEFDPERLLERLTARGVDFVLVGGYAAVIHGSPRLTQDLDIAFSIEADNLRALGRALADLEARLYGVEDEVPFAPDHDVLRRIEVLTLDTSAGKLDLLAKPPGAPPYARLRSNARRVDIGELAIPVASIDDLIAMKEAAGRPKDLADIEELEAIRRLSSGRGRARTS